MIKICRRKTHVISLKWFLCILLFGVGFLISGCEPRPPVCNHSWVPYTVTEWHRIWIDCPPPGQYVFAKQIKTGVRCTKCGTTILP